MRARSPPKIPAWRRSFALRTALLAAAAMLAVSVLGSAWGWLNAERALRQQLDIILAAEADGLLRDYEALVRMSPDEVARLAA